MFIINTENKAVITHHRHIPASFKGLLLKFWGRTHLYLVSTYSLFHRSLISLSTFFSAEGERALPSIPK